MRMSFVLGVIFENCEIAVLARGGGGGGGGTLIFSHIRRLGPFFGFKILNFNIFWGFQKNEYFWGYEDFVAIFWGVITKFFKVKVQNWDIFLGC